MDLKAKGKFVHWLFWLSTLLGTGTIAIMVVIGTIHQAGQWGGLLCGVVAMSVIGVVASLWLSFFWQLEALGHRKTDRIDQALTGG